MISLARLSLLYEWKRYLAAIFAVAFSGLLILVQLGLLLGMFSSVSIVIDQAAADLWVANKKTKSFDLARELPTRLESSLRLHPAVTKLESFSISWGDWRSPNGSKSLVYPVGFDIGAQSLSLPKGISEQLRLKLQEPGSVIIDQVDAKKLGVNVGDVAEIDSQRVKIVGMVDGYRNIGGAYVFTSDFTLKSLLGSAYNSDYTQYFLLQLKKDALPTLVRDQLNNYAPNDPYHVWLPQDFSNESQLYWLFESGAGASFGFSVLLGLLVGVAITSQTLRGTVLNSIREYATLRALGVSLKSLRRVVIEQSFWVGIAGLAITILLSYATLWLALVNKVSMKIPLWSLAITGIFTISVALFSGLISLRILYKTQPADLLR